VYSGTSQTASSKHGRRRTERSRLGASVDGETRQETALLTVRPRRGTRRRSLVLRTRCRRTSVVRCRWRRRIESPHVGHRTTAHSTRLEALTDVPLELRSSRLLEVSSRTALFDLKRRTARYAGRQFASSKFARTNCSETQLRAHVFAGNSTHTDGTQLFSRSGDLVPSAPKHRHILQAAQRRTDTGAHCHVTGRTARSSSAAQTQVHCHVTGPERFQRQHTRAHQKAN